MSQFTPTDEQQSILRHDFGRHACILAGPGTGESMMLVALADRMLGQPDAPSVRFLTFTRAATAELHEKISEVVGSVALRPSTIHSFAISTLLQNGGMGGFPEPLRIADTWESKQICLEGLRHRLKCGKARVEKLIREMAANWESLLPARDPEISESERASFLGTWHEHRQIYGYTLLSELPFALLRAMQSHDSLNGLQFQLMIVDEYQDLNACDLEVIKQVSLSGCRIIAAGDDEQSVYSFRKAHPEGIRRFSRDYVGAATYPLTISKRCAKQIVRWANFVIQGDPDRPKERVALLPATDAPEGEVGLLAFADENREAWGVAAIAKGLVEQEGVRPSEILILTRSDHNATFSKPIKIALSAMGVPCSESEKAVSTLAEPRNRRLIELLRLLVDRHDSLAWSGLLNLTSGVGRSFHEYIYQRCRARGARFGTELLSALEEGFPDAPRGPANRARALISEILTWLEESQLPPQPPAEGWDHWIACKPWGDESTPQLTEEFHDLLIGLDELAETDRTLGKFTSQMEPLGRDLAQSKSEGVRIMTMTAAKGLTVTAAIVAGAEEGLVPRPDGDPAEERRILYVAMTRARRFLYCTWARKRIGPTARAGAASKALRIHSLYLQSGPVQSEDGSAFIRKRYPAMVATC